MTTDVTKTGGLLPVFVSCLASIKFQALFDWMLLVMFVSVIGISNVVGHITYLGLGGMSRDCLGSM